MPLDINPLNDFAFMKTFATPENDEALVGLLNAVLRPKTPITSVSIQNPFNYKDFEDDKLSILDIKALDAARAWYDVEVQLQAIRSTIQRVVYYNCKLYASQLEEGDDYQELLPAYSIWLVDDVLWPKSAQMHHAFRLTDEASGRVLENTVAIHMLELPKYNKAYSDLQFDDSLGWWLYWLRHASAYEPDALRAAFPQEAIRRASETLIKIAANSEDRAMYDAQEKARRDQKWLLNEATREARQEGLREGKLEGELKGKLEGELKVKIQMARMFQELLYLAIDDEGQLSTMSLEELDALIASLREQLRGRRPL